VVLGIIPLKEIIELTHFRWFGHVVTMGDKRSTEMAWKVSTQGKGTKGKLRQTCEEWIQMILK
jgi:hypothetical protein